MKLSKEELAGLSQKEKEIVLSILKEYKTNGASVLYNTILTDDYEEIPVTVSEFLHNPKYLGKGLTDDEGRFTIFPYWEELLKKIFPDPLKPAMYNTLALTGSIGIGKSTEAVIIGCYELYRMLCLKDPYLHYGLQPIDLITFAVMNITMDAAKGVAWSKLQTLIQSSEWFMQRGTVTKGDSPEWKPPKGIELIYGSQSRHIIGRAVYWCLEENTEILTDLGTYKIKDLVDKEIKVFNIKNNSPLLSDICTVKPTNVTNEEYHIELEDGTIIKCTPNHRFLLKDGSYKEAQFLTEEDELFEFNPIGYVYRTTNLITNKSYIGQHKTSQFDKNYYGSGLLIQRSLSKYGKKNHKVEILDWACSVDELNYLETQYILKEKLLTENCLNLSAGAKGGHENYSHSPKSYVNTPNKGKIAINDGVQVKYIFPHEDIPCGWKIGNCNTAKKHDMSKYYLDLDKQEKNSLSKSGSKNSSFGNGHRVSGGKNGKAVRDYWFEGKYFECRKYLCEYLNKIGHHVSVNILRKIENGNYTDRFVKKHQYLIDNLMWRNKNEDKIH